jgi:hypothetical protein
MSKIFLLISMFVSVISSKSYVNCQCTPESGSLRCNCGGQEHSHKDDHHLGVYCELNNQGQCHSELKERNYCHCTGNHKECDCDKHDYSDIKQFYCQSMPDSDRYVCYEHINDNFPIKNYQWVDFLCVTPSYYQDHRLSEGGSLWYNEHTRLLNLCSPICGAEKICVVKVHCHHRDKAVIDSHHHSINDQVICDRLSRHS